MDAAVRKKVLRSIPYALYVVGVAAGEEMSAFTGNWLTQTSFEPPLVAVAFNVEGDSYRIVREGGIFSVNFLLRDEGKALAERFFKPARRVGNKVADVPFTTGSTGAPLLDAAPAWFEAEVRQIVEMGDHHLVIGEVIDAGLRNDDAVLLLADTPWSYGG